MSFLERSVLCIGGSIRIPLLRPAAYIYRFPQKIGQSSPILIPGRVQSAEPEIQDDFDDADDFVMEAPPPPLSLSPDDSDMVCFNMDKSQTSSESPRNSSGSPLVNQKRRFKKLFSNASTRGSR